MSLIKVQMRFDGTLGFPGGIADKGETPEMAVNREMSEELGCSVDKFAVTAADHLFSKVSDNLKRGRKFCLHSYAKEISLETLQQLEKSSLVGSDYGLEVIIESVYISFVLVMLGQTILLMLCLVWSDHFSFYTGMEK